MRGQERPRKQLLFFVVNKAQLKSESEVERKVGQQ
jgi:hypothetical protein